MVRSGEKKDVHLVHRKIGHEVALWLFTARIHHGFWVQFLEAKEIRGEGKDR